MSAPHEVSRNISYDPLPLTSEDHHSDALYNTPPSPDPRLSGFHTPQMIPEDLDPDGTAIPPGAAPPRFLGAALYSDSPSIRDSFASSHRTSPVNNGSEYTGSVYALNDTTEPAARFQGEYHDDPRDSFFAGDRDAVQMSPVGRVLEEKRAAYEPPRAKSRRKVVILAIIAALVLLILAVVIPIYFAVVRPNSHKGAVADTSGSKTAAPKPTSTGTGTGTGTNKPISAIVSGGDGSLVTMEDGTTFTYRNPFGGMWYWDENDPFNNGAKAQSWSPALNETFNYGVDKIRGVNFGGWLNTEPFMQVARSLYEPYVNNSTPAVDEWTLSLAMTADTANGGLSQLENHYKTFITEQDFAEVAGAGLNFIRVPIGYWAVETRSGEPFLSKVSWTYFLKAVQWARKYGLRINLDLHSLPGSQNGWNHSGRLGTIGVLNGPMGYANAQRSLTIIQTLAEFISQPQYKDVVAILGIVNEPQGTTVGQSVLSSFYLEAYNIVRKAGGTGAGNGPFVSIHDGFFPQTRWVDIFPGADRMMLDDHPYLCFQGQSSAPMSSYATTPCTSWGGGVNNSMASFGLTAAGEFSNAVTDCGLYLNGVSLGTRYEGTFDTTVVTGDCKPWTDWQNYDATMKQSIKKFALASMDALQDYFFWTWKIGNSSVTGTVETPAWSYQLGLQNGWMPTDPREAIGTCGNSNPWSPPLSPYQIGGAGAGQIPTSVLNALAWPPPTFSTGGAVTLLPSYTPTGAVPTLPAPTFTQSGATPTATVNAGNGWANAADTLEAYVPIPSCTYLDPWVDPGTAPPSPLCS